MSQAQDWALGCWTLIPAGKAVVRQRGKCAKNIPGPFNVVGWTVDPRDYELDETKWKEVYERVINGWVDSSSQIPGTNIPIGNVSRVFRSSRFGSDGIQSDSDIVLFHSGQLGTALALPNILLWIKEKGYSFDLPQPAWSNP
jgi:hypothetical protein